MKGGHWCPLYNYLFRKRSKLAYLGCNFVSKEGTIFLKWVLKNHQFAQDVFVYVFGSTVH